MRSNPYLTPVFFGSTAFVFLNFDLPLRADDLGIDAVGTGSELQRLALRIGYRVGRHLERRGLLVRDAENADQDWDSEQASALDDLAGHSITYTVAVGPHHGQQAFTLQTLPAVAPDGVAGELATAGGFSLHAGIATKADQRDKFERLCRYVASSAIADGRLSLTRDGRDRYSLKTRPEYSHSPWNAVMMQAVHRGKLDNIVGLCRPFSSTVRRIHVQ